jgi:hypothetical protein
MWPQGACAYCTLLPTDAEATSKAESHLENGQESFLSDHGYAEQGVFVSE